MTVAHVVPCADLVAHDTDEDCVCGPALEAVPRPDGSTGWVAVHHALDGRELREPCGWPERIEVVSRTVCALGGLALATIAAGLLGWMRHGEER